VPYLNALEVCSRQGAIQIHVYLYLYLYLILSTHALTVAVLCCRIFANKMLVMPKSIL